MWLRRHIFLWISCENRPNEPYSAVVSAAAIFSFPFPILLSFLFKEYEDLDEIIARYIQSMVSHAREVINHRYYKETEGLKQKLEEILVTEKRKNPSRIPYFFSASQTYPGKFMLGYMPRNRPRVEYVTVCPEGFRYRGRVHGTVNGLLRWFKEHFRDPIPGLIFHVLKPPLSSFCEGNCPCALFPHKTIAPLIES